MLAILDRYLAKATPPTRRALKLALPILCTVATLGAVKIVAQSHLIAPGRIAPLIAGLGIWAPALFLAALVVRPILLLPGQAFAAAAGMLFGVSWGSLLCVAGSALSALLVIGLGRRLLGRRLARWSGVDRDELARVARRHDSVCGALVTLNPLLPSDLCLALAAGAGARPWRLAVGASLGTIPGTVATALYGSAVVKDAPWALALGLSGIAASIVGGALLGRSALRELKPRPLYLCAGTENRPSAPIFPRRALRHALGRAIYGPREKSVVAASPRGTSTHPYDP